MTRERYVLRETSNLGYITFTIEQHTTDHFGSEMLVSEKEFDVCARTNAHRIDTIRKQAHNCYPNLERKEGT